MGSPYPCEWTIQLNPDQEKCPDGDGSGADLPVEDWQSLGHTHDPRSGTHPLRQHATVRTFEPFQITRYHVIKGNPNIEEFNAYTYKVL